MNCLSGSVIANIVSRLGPIDCIECFQVCRQWQHFIRLFAALPFRDITVDEYSLKILAHIHVFGRFMRTARVNLRLYDTLIKTLDRLKSCSLLQKLELRNVSITLPYVVRTKLLSCFKKWHLDTFAIINVQSLNCNITDYMLLATEHNIRHFAFTCEEMYPFPVKEPLLQSSHLSTLVSLIINNPAMRSSDFTTLLSYTPNIEYMELSPIRKISMSTIFTLCPKLTHVDLTFFDATTADNDIYPKDYMQYPAKAASADDQEVYPGLRYYSDSHSYFDQSEYDMLLRHQSTLEHVNVGYCHPSTFTPDWTTFNQCFLPNITLKHLVLPMYRQQEDTDLQYDDGYANWLNACQALVHLEFTTLWHVFGKSMLQTLQCQLPSLQRIDITLDPSIERESGLFINYMDLLQALVLRCDHTDTFNELQICLSGRYNPCNISLILSSVLKIRSLQRLTVRANGYYYHLEEPNILAFVEELQFSLPCLTHLRLGYIFQLSVNVIHALATLYWIKSFAIGDDVINVNEAELLIATMGKNLKHLYFVNCELERDANDMIHLLSLARNYSVNCFINTCE